jgi:hypothetical protein
MTSPGKFEYKTKKLNFDDQLEFNPYNTTRKQASNSQSRISGIGTDGTDNLVQDYSTDQHDYGSISTSNNIES